MSQYQVLVKPQKSHNRVYWQEKKVSSTEQVLIVETTASPINGQANTMIIKLIADFFQVPKSTITIKNGFKSRKKIIIID